MHDTYDKAIAEVLKDEGGYTNDANDPGGPTNWGITIHDARQYWKPHATAEDVKEIPLSVAKDIYWAHYATPISYDSLPAGVDYTILDFGVNSGINRAVRTLQNIVGVVEDGHIGPATLSATASADPRYLINAIYDKRLAFLKSLHTWKDFGKGWNSRCIRGRAFALSLVTMPQAPKPKFSFFAWLSNLFLKKGTL